MRYGLCHRVLPKGSNPRKEPKFRPQDSLILKTQGGVSAEEMATRRKQKQNLDNSGTKHLNPFAVLNSIDDDVLLQRTKDLDLRLAEDDTSSKAVITAIKAEEQLWAAVAEATYQDHLDSLKHKECVQEDDVLDLTIIGNSQRGCSIPSDSLVESDKNKVRVRRAIGKRKKRDLCFGT
jgi:hypothetical protein